MVKAGEWRPSAPFKGKRGYYLNGLNVLFKAKRGFRNRLHQMAVGFLDAKKRGKESLKTWTNTFLAETWEDEAQEAHKPELIYARREDYAARLPEKCVVLVAGADVQADRIECEIVGAGEGEETWGIEYRTFTGNIETWALWDELDAFLQKKFLHASGAELSVAAACVDSGHKGKIVYSFVKRCQPRRVFAVKGIGTNGVPWVTRSRKAPVLLLKTHTAKEAIYSRLNLTEPGPGYQHFPIGYDLEYFRQLVSERVVTRFRFGNAYHAFEEHGRNEALDARVYAMAALELLRPNYAALERNLALTAQESRPNNAQAQSARPVQQPRRGLVRNWKR
jgi:phage terminase large subunit GpA-like protein